MHIKPFRAVYPCVERIASADAFFSSIKEDYSGYLQGSLFEQSAHEVLYVYQIRAAAYCYTGLLACVDIRDYLEGHIRQHEHTLAAKEQTQLSLLTTRKAAVKPVLLAYPAVEAISNWVKAYLIGKAPGFSIALEEEAVEEHSFWEVSAEADLLEIQRLFAQFVPNTYIADGHHRAAATAHLYAQALDGGLAGRYDLLLSAFFPSSDIAILDFNRVVRGLNGHTPTAFMAQLSRYCEIEVLAQAAKPTRKHEITMLLKGEWYRLRWKESVMLYYADEPLLLDAMLLDETVFRKLLGIEDVRTDQRIHYVEGPKGLEGISSQVNGQEDSAAFCLYPIQLQEMITLADLGQVLPPKSTWFLPRMKNGLVVQLF